MRFAHAGTVDQTLVDIVAANVREPIQVVGDLYSLATCNEIGCRRLIEMMDEFAIDDLDRLGTHMLEKSKQVDGESRDALNRAQGLLSQGDYEGSLRENQRALSVAANESPGDEALFNMGLIYADAENPKKDYRRAMSFFGRLPKEYPQSPLVGQAKIWLGVLQANEKLTQMLERSRQVDIEIEEKRRER